jgi:hypothetical protein
MPTEKQTRDAIATVIRLVVDSTTTVIGRDAMGLFRQGDYKPLLASGATHTRGWIVTQVSAEQSEKADTFAEYTNRWRVWQLHEYFTGTDADNSEDIASAERETVLGAFADLNSVTGIDQTTLDALVNLGGLSFSSITTVPMTEGGKLFHWAQGEVSGLYRTAGC